MSQPIFYQPPPKWHIFVALACAIVVEATAVATASLQSKVVIPTINGESAEPVFQGVLVEEPPEETPPPLQLPDENPSPLLDELSEFVLPESPRQTSTPTKAVHVAKPAETQAIHGRSRPLNFVRGQATMIHAPRPAYPFEARRALQTGVGKFLLRFNAAGDVIEVKVTQSTGSKFLDQAARSAFEQWRCRPGAYEAAYVPVTFTLAGAQL